MFKLEPGEALGHNGGGGFNIEINRKIEKSVVNQTYILFFQGLLSDTFIHKKR